jgi:ATP-dependent helicase/nuclease subunit B
VRCSSFLLDEDAIASPSLLLDELPRFGLMLARDETAHPRVFRHEALAAEAPELDHVPRAAAAWARLRLSRTPQSDRRFHGFTDARPIRGSSVSALERYLACPFKYFSARVLRLPDEPEEEEALSPRARGRRLHEMLAAFFIEWDRRGGARIDDTTIDRARALFEEMAASALQPLGETDRALERAYLFGTAATPGAVERILEFEAARTETPTRRLIEHRIDGAHTFADGESTRTLVLRGVVDRVDLFADGGLRTYDYKLGEAPPADRSLQPGVYSLAVAQQLERTGEARRIEEGGYLAFRGRSLFTSFAPRRLGLQGALLDVQQRLLRAVSGIEAGEFPPRPADLRLCASCAYAGVCRKDYGGVEADRPDEDAVSEEERS